MGKTVLVMRKSWREDLHPRGGSGRFAFAPDTGGNPQVAAGGGTATKETLQKVAFLTGILETGQSKIVQNHELGDITIDRGETGKNGYGLAHIIKNRSMEGRNEEDMAAILHLVVQAATEGRITRRIADKNTPDNIRRVEIEKDGIIALVSLQRNQNEEKWLLTGFDSNEKKEEATEAIQTVIAKYGHTPEFSYFRKQVGAVVSSLQKISPKTLKKSRPRLMIKKNIAAAIMRSLGGRL